jgi:hypothetical protein
MSGYFEDLVRRDLATDLREGSISMVPDEPYYSGLADAFPLTGSRIDWSRVPNAVTSYEVTIDRKEAEAFIDFFNEMVAVNQLDGVVVFLGDQLNFALRLPLEVLRKNLESLVSIPQHCYVLVDNFAWCMVFSFEGDMAFGYRPGHPHAI